MQNLRIRIKVVHHTFWYDSIILKSLKFSMLQIIGQNLWTGFYEWKGKTCHNNKLRYLNNLISMLFLVTFNVTCCGALLCCESEKESHFCKSFACQFLTLSHAEVFHQVILLLSLSHTFSHVNIPYPSCHQDSIKSLLSMPLLELLVLVTFHQALASLASLTVFYRLLCILQQYCHALFL